DGGRRTAGNPRQGRGGVGHRCRCRAGREHHVYPVVAIVPPRTRVRTPAAVVVDSGRGSQRRGENGPIEVVLIDRVLAFGGEIGRRIPRSGRDRYRGREGYRLPSGRRLVLERGSGQQSSRTGP